MDRAVVTAIACETVAQTKQSLSRQSLADLTRRVREVLAKPMSRSTVWRVLQEDAIQPFGRTGDRVGKSSVRIAKA